MPGTAAVAVGAALLALFLRPHEKELSSLVAAGAMLFLFGNVWRKMYAPLDEFVTLCARNGAGETAGVLMRALGIVTAAHLAAELCREAGEGALGTQVEIAAKAEIALLCLPMAVRLLERIGELLA